MASAYLIKVEGLDSVLAKFGTMEKTAKRAALAGIKAGGKITLARARTLSPVSSGRMRASLQLRSSSVGRFIGVRIGSPLPYAGPRMYASHIGGPFARSNPPDPFLNQAIDETSPAVEAAVRVTVQTLIDEIFSGR